jgi:putative nucleotidyltransferase with HDIG domain
MDRAEAFALLNEYTKNPALIKHALAVEAAMRAYAGRFGEDVDVWGVIGLIHDFDYERYPTAADHPYRGAEILRSKGVPEDWIRTIMSHADYVDELCGFLTAVALVRPDKKIASVEVASVRKKMKQKAFAAQVSREDMINGAADLGVDLDEHIAFVIAAMASVAAELGL